MGNNFIKEVSIGGLLSFDKAAFELELKPLNVLIGANGSGKSNFLEVSQSIELQPWLPPQHLLKR